MSEQELLSWIDKQRVKLMNIDGIQNMPHELVRLVTLSEVMDYIIKHPITEEVEKFFGWLCGELDMPGSDWQETMLRAYQKSNLQPTAKESNED